MTIREVWRLEARVVAWCAAGGAGLALVGGTIAWSCALALALYSARHVRAAYLLATWLERARTLYPPDGDGIWGEIFRRQAARQKEHRTRKRRVARMLTRFQQSTRAIPDGLVVIDDDHQIQWTNSAATRLLGVSAPRDAGQRLEHFIRFPEFGGFLANPDSAALTIRSPLAANRYLEIRRVPFAEATSLVIARDATERFRVEQMRKDFVADVSHELRTPLTVLSGYVENMNRNPGSVPDTWRRPIEAMTEQTTRMRLIVDDLLLLARMEGSVLGTREPVEVANLAAVLVENARTLSGARKHNLVLEADDRYALSGVRSELETAFGNLVNNAVQHTPPGSDITIRWQATERGACFEVCDNGPGVDAEFVPRLAERFFRVDKGRSREQGGTGLGLSIVRHILARHGAELQIESAPGEGSIFRCQFAAADVVSADAATFRRAAPD